MTLHNDGKLGEYCKRNRQLLFFSLYFYIITVCLCVFQNFSKKFRNKKTLGDLAHYKNIEKMSEKNTTKKCAEKNIIYDNINTMYKQDLSNLSKEELINLLIKQIPKYNF